MADPYETIFGNMPLSPGYGNMPESSNIEDIRQRPPDYTPFMQNPGSDRSLDPSTYASPPPNTYTPSPIGGSVGGTQGVYPGYEMPGDLRYVDSNEVAPYSPSFRPGLKAQPIHQMPYQYFDYGPNLPPRPIDPALLRGITPGSPGWRPPLQNGNQAQSLISPHVGNLLRWLGDYL